MDSNKGYIHRLLILVTILLVGGTIYYLFSPLESSFFPKCPFHSITGLDCPGCGSQRALHHLIHLEIGMAFRSNPLLIISIPYIIIGIYIEYFGGKEKYPRIRKILFGKNAAIIAFIVIILFWIGRNLL